MSVNHLPGRIKFKHDDEKLTSNVSLLGLHGLAKQFGLIKAFKQYLPGYSSNRAFRNFKYPYLQVLTRGHGGVGLEATRRISADLHLGRLLFPEQAKAFENHPGRTESYFPAPNTLGGYYRDTQFMHAHRARRINRQMCARMLETQEIKQVHIDIDSKIHASDNKKAKKTREGYTGYAPLYATVPTAGLVLDPLFCPGNTAPAKHNASMTRTILKWLRGVALERVEITLDAAGCQVDVIKAISQANMHSDKQIYFYTRPSSPDKTIPDKMHRSIEQANHNWKPIKMYYKNNRKKYRYMTENEKKQRKDDELSPAQILDTDYTLTSPSDYWTSRLILVRKPVQKQGAQKCFAHGWRYYPVLTNDYESDPIEIHPKYNQRGAGEDLISEMVLDQEAERFPCRDDEGNALYLALCAMGHNLVQAMQWMTQKQFDEILREQKQSSTTEMKKGQNDQKPPQSKCVKKTAQEVNQLLSVDGDTETSWFQFTVQKFKHLLLSIPARIGSGSGYRTINFSLYEPFGQLLERVICACWNPIHFESARDPT